MKTHLHWTEPFGYTRQLSRRPGFDLLCAGACGALFAAVALIPMWARAPHPGAPQLLLALAVFLVVSVLDWVFNLWLARAEVRLQEDGIRRVWNKFGPEEFLAYAEIERCVLSVGSGPYLLLEVIPRADCPAPHRVRMTAIPRGLALERLRETLHAVRVSLVERA